MECVVKPWLIQRCAYKSAPRPLDFGVDDVLRFDYMGSAEYEWGAIPMCVRAMAAKGLGIIKYVSPRNNCKTFYVLCNVWQAKAYIERLNEIAMAKSPYGLFKETVTLAYFLQGQYVIERNNTYRDDDFWLDLDNGIAISEDRNALDEFKVALGNSVKRMDEKVNKAKVKDNV